MQFGGTFPLDVRQGNRGFRCGRIPTAMPHQTRWEEDAFIAEFWGEVSAWEIEAVNDEFNGSPKFDTARFALWDMSRAERLVVTEVDVESAAAIDKGASMIRRDLRGAIVVPAGQVRELVEQYLAVSRELESSWDTRLFDDTASARRWLAD